MSTKHEIETLTPAEVSKVISQCSRRAPTGVRNRALLWLMYRSGMRVSEALALRTRDIDLDKHTATAQHAKGGKRVVYHFTPDADDALLRWMDVRRDELGKRGLAGNASRTFFCTLTGTPVLPSYVRALLPRLAKRAGVDKRVHPHALRHSFAVELLHAGVPIDAISRLLGHTSIAITSRYLQHLTNADAGRQLQAIALPALDVRP